MKAGTCKTTKVLCLSDACILRPQPTHSLYSWSHTINIKDAVYGASGRGESEELWAERGLPRWYKLSP